MAADLQALVKKLRRQSTLFAESATAHAESEAHDDEAYCNGLSSAYADAADELEAALRAEAGAVGDDDGCVCRGNWRLIVKEEESRIGQKFNDANGDVWTFFGVVWADDDFYYGMCRQGRTMLLTCCGSIEAGGYTPVLTALAQARRTDAP